MSEQWEYNLWIISSIVVANLFPLVGLLIAGWGVTELLAVYWLEWGIAVVVGIMKTVPARLVTLPLDKRNDLSIRNKRGAVTLGSVPCYVRNAPLLAILLIALLSWIVTGLLAFHRSASPFAYSTMETTFPVVAVAASLLALSHLVTIRPYFDEQRYRRTSPTEAIGPPLAYTLGMTSLIFLLADLGDHVANLGWLTAYPIAIAAGKASLELLTRCRNRARFEQIDEDVDPFAATQTIRQIMSPKRQTSELPAVARPNTPPRTTVQPNRWGVIAVSPLVGLGNRLGGIWFGLLFGFAAVIMVLGGSLPFALVLGGVAIVGVTLLGLAISVPRHATLEYEFYDDQLVCYDRWLEEPQWRLPYAQIERVLIARSVVGRTVGYGTVCLETADNESARLPYLRAYWNVADHLDQTRTQVKDR